MDLVIDHGGIICLASTDGLSHHCATKDILKRLLGQADAQFRYRTLTRAAVDEAILYGTGQSILT